MWHSVPSNSTFRADLPQAHSTSALDAPAQRQIGPHDGFAALGAEVSKCPHLFFHGMRLLTGMFPLDEDYTTTRNSCTEFFEH